MAWCTFTFEVTNLHLDSDVYVVITLSVWSVGGCCGSVAVCRTDRKLRNWHCSCRAGMKTVRWWLQNLPNYKLLFAATRRYVRRPAMNSLGSIWKHIYLGPKSCSTLWLDFFAIYKYTDTTLHPYNGLFSSTTWVSQYQKGKTSLDLNGARGVAVLGGSGISWTICKQSAPCSRLITTPTPHHSIFTGQLLFLTPTRAHVGCCTVALVGP